MQYAIGLDLGGSSAKVALVTGRGDVLAEDEVAISSSTDPAEILDPVAASVDRLRQIATQRAMPVVALGCGFSGYLDDARVVIEQNNTPAFNGFALEAWLRHRFGLPASVDNDACVAAFAETRVTAAMGRRRVLFVTIGSGIGVVLLVDGVIVRVMKGLTGDASHLIVAFGSDVRCPYGCYGCLETVASARAIARAGWQAAQDATSPALAETLRHNGDVTGLDVSVAASSGDAVAQEILARAGQWLGVGITSWACTYAPDLVVLGGAVAQAGDVWLNSAITTMRALGSPFCDDNLVVTRARLGNRAGVIGAALLALENLEGPHV